MTLCLLWVSSAAGAYLYPIYTSFWIYLDKTATLSRVKKRNKRIRKVKKYRLLTMARSLCVFTEVHNVHAQDLVMLSRMQYKYRNSIPYKCIKMWNEIRQSIGQYPPDGWPLRILMLMMAIVAVIGTIWQAHQRIRSKLKMNNMKNEQQVFQSQKVQNGAILRSEVFDGDSDTIIVDNAANCIIWRHKKNFDKENYVRLGTTNAVGVASAVGSGVPIGVGNLNIGWRDDAGQYHKFLLKNVLHIPDSPVNILGLSAFSKAIGDYDTKGTRINSSGSESIFTWENEKYSKSFTHSEANMPEMIVNDGYSSFHRFCNFIDRFNPISNQCYHTRSPEIMQLKYGPYKHGEEVIYKNEDHVEKGIIEDVYRDPSTKDILYEIKFRDDRRLKTFKENIMAKGETDVSLLPNEVSDFIHQSKCLTADEVEMIRNPKKLTNLQKEWKIIHDQYGHLPFSMMDKLVENNLLPGKYKALKGQNILCPSCIFGKMRKRAWRSKSKNVKTIRKESENFAGAKVSVDQLVVAQPGLVPRISGKHTNARICGATGYFDNHTGYSFSSLQTSLDGEQTLASKHAFEAHAKSCGVNVKAYRADNGSFAEKSFRDDVRNAQQKIDFCAVGAHHQNGIIERHFQKLSSQARIILLHAKRHWPAMISVILWPFAYKYAELLYNHLNVDDRGYAPVQKFCSNTATLDLKTLRTWGYPCYVLDATLQSGSMKAKWEPRSRLGIYLGHSPCHAGTVALVLNPSTLHVSPQFHVAFDDHFATVPYLASNDVPPNWAQIVKQSEKVSENDYDLAKLWLQSNDLLRDNLPNQEGDGNANTDTNTMNSEGARRKKVTMNLEGDKNMEIMLQPTLPDLDMLTRRKSTRAPQPTQKALESNDNAVKRMFGLATVSMQTGKENEQKGGTMLALVTHYHNINLLFDGTINQCHRLMLSTIAPNNDVYTLSEMLKLEDIKDFVLAMLKEVAEHEARDHWELVQRKDLPVGAKTILSVWAFKRKRHPDGTVYKHKARLNAHGGMQRWGVDYWETYAPVVNWISVRLMLILTVVHKLETKSIDFVLAFPQAELKRDVFMEMLYGFRFGRKGQYVLKLKRNLYGLADASLNWFKKLTAGLESEGFVKSEIDQCVFIRNNCIIMVYVDDMIAISSKKEVLEELVENLRGKDYILTDEGPLTKYLGVDVKYNKRGGFELAQPFLIERIINLLGVNANESNWNTRPTPAVKPLLHKDTNGIPRNNSWNYRTAIGMLTYLQGTSRPDISMAVHQCARFSMKPMLSHERAVKRIGRYLLGTREKGIVYNPDMSKGLECYVDADFAGGWSKEDVDNPDNVLSRTGYILMYAGCPLIWASRMQTEIALSTAEAEYIACSTAMRDVLSTMQIMEEIDKIFPLVKMKPKVHCKVYEDNESCIAMAKNRKFSPRTKHIAIKYHHFRRHVNKTVTLHSIDTNEQIADAWTKPLEQPQFEYLRKKYCGW